jgi:hypothetical protein
MAAAHRGSGGQRLPVTTPVRIGTKDTAPRSSRSTDPARRV